MYAVEKIITWMAMTVLSQKEAERGTESGNKMEQAKNPEHWFAALICGHWTLNLVSSLTR